MARSGELEAFLTDARLNALLGWVLVGFMALVGVESFFDSDWAWVIVSVFVVGLAILPPIRQRSATMMLPWEVLLLVMFPLLGRTLFATGLVSDIASYLAVASVALVIAVELDAFTPVKMTTLFAVFFVSIVTMAAAGAWAVIQWLSDLYLGTDLVYPTQPPVSDVVEEAALEALMWDFVAATIAGIMAGLLFALYFRRRMERLNEYPDTRIGGVP